MVSVCIATYNGEMFIKEQLFSILTQLQVDDEVIVCDDGSTDSTVALINSFNDSRVKVFINDSNLGYIKNFEKAISKASGDYVFLSDQDDIWPEGRCELMIKASVDSGKNLVVGNIETFTDNPNIRCEFSKKLSNKHNRLGIFNIVRMLIGGIPYFGCCMMITSKFKSEMFGFNSVSHDVFMAMLGNYKNDINHIEDVVIFRRVHGNNLTKRRGLMDRLKTRFVWLLLLLKILLFK